MTHGTLHKINCGGYNLLQMAMSLIIIGLFITAFTQWYNINTIKHQEKTNSERVTVAMNALQEFRKIHGHYPCPASLDATRTDQAYGHETNCTVGTQAVGTCGNVALRDPNIIGATGRVCIQRASSATASLQHRVRIGTLPFRDLKIMEKSAYDAYGQRLIYVMTEKQGDSNSYNESITGITVVDQNNAIITRAADSVSHLVFSVGKDGLGGISAAGTGNFPCLGGNATGADALDAENCDTEALATFKFSVQNEVVGANHFDDQLAYFSDLALPVWKRGEDGATPALDHTNDIVELAINTVGVGVGEAENPTAFAELDIQSTYSAGNPTSPYGDIRAAGTLGDGNGILKTTSICHADGTKCFNPALFVGNLPDGPDPDILSDAECPDGQYVVGISEGKVVCQPNINVECPTGKVLRSINTTTGELDCIPAPFLNCNAGSWIALDCPGQFFVAQADYPHGTIATPRYAYNTTTRVSCNNGTLRKNSTSGSCSCTDNTYVQNFACNNCDYLDEPERSECLRSAALAGNYSATVNHVCNPVVPVYKPKWTAAKPTAAPDITNLKTNFALTFNLNTMTGDVPDGNSTHLASAPNEQWNITGGSGSWATACQTCADTTPDGTLRNVDTGYCSSPFTGTETKEQRFNAAACEWQDTGNETNCTCDKVARNVAALCPDNYVRGTVTNPAYAPLFASKGPEYGIVQAQNVSGTCSYVDAGTVANYCTCNVGYVQEYETDPGCPDGYEMSVKAKYKKTLTSCPDGWGTPELISPVQCVPVNYVYKEISENQSNAATSVLNGISRVLGNSCSYAEANAGTQFVCKKNSSTYSCYCGK